MNKRFSSTHRKMLRGLIAGKHPSDVVRPGFKDRIFARAWAEEAADLDMSDFESLSDCVERQKQMLSRFMFHKPKQKGWEELRRCKLSRCAVDQCSEACHFGTYRRRMDTLRTGLPLLQQHPGPLMFVTLVHPLWKAQVSELNTISIAAAARWNRRRLASLKISGLIAMGGFEASHNIELDGTQHWAGHIHQIVAGATEEQLKKAFTIQPRYRLVRPNQKIVHIEDDIESVPRTFGYCQKRLVHTKPATTDEGGNNRDEKPPSAKIWAEFDEWLFSLPLGGRIVLFGCARRGTTIYMRD